MSKRHWQGFGIALLGIALIAALPLILPAAAVLHSLDCWRMRGAARRFTCLSCGTRLGREAIRLADDAWARELAERQAASPGALFRHGLARIIRHLYAICPHCGARYDFDRRGGTFTALDRGGR